MGEVYRARDTKLGREVAIKVLPAAFAQDAERVARLEREARMLAALNHPNIAAIYGLEQHEDTNIAEQTVLVYSLDDGETTALPVLAVTGSAGMPFSPDGDWFAYFASRAEDAVPTQVYVQPYPPTGTDIPVTPEGGSYPVFSAEDRLTYRRAAPPQAVVNAANSSPTEVVSIDLQLEGGVTFGEERAMNLRGMASVFGFRDFDPTPDGQRFIMALYPDQPEFQEVFQPQINVVLNWVEELKERVPVP